MLANLLLKLTFYLFSACLEHLSPISHAFSTIYCRFNIYILMPYKKHLRLFHLCCLQPNAQAWTHMNGGDTKTNRNTSAERVCFMWLNYRIFGEVWCTGFLDLLALKMLKLLAVRWYVTYICVKFYQRKINISLDNYLFSIAFWHVICLFPDHFVAYQLHDIVQ